MPDSRWWSDVVRAHKQAGPPTDSDLERWSGHALAKDVGTRLIAEVRRLRAEVERVREERDEAQHYLGLARHVIREDVEERRRAHVRAQP